MTDLRPVAVHCPTVTRNRSPQVTEGKVVDIAVEHHHHQQEKNLSHLTVNVAEVSDVPQSPVYFRAK